MLYHINYLELILFEWVHLSIFPNSFLRALKKDKEQNCAICLSHFECMNEIANGQTDHQTL